MSVQLATFVIGVGFTLFTQPITALMQNKQVNLILIGGYAATVANHLKIKYPAIVVQKTPVSVAFITVALLTIIIGQPLVNVLNFAMQRNYKISARYDKGFSGIQDDQLRIFLEP